VKKLGLLLVLFLSSSAVFATTFDLKNDWTMNNPNGPWSYLSGSTLLPYQTNNIGGMWPGFAPNVVSGHFLPFFVKQDSWANGDVVIHSWDPTNGQGQEGTQEAVLMWTAPSTGTIDVSGYLYYYHPPDYTRSNDFSLDLGLIHLASGTIAHDSYYDKANEFTISYAGLAVTAGDVLALTIKRTPGEEWGTFTALDLTIIETSAVPEPSSLILLGAGLGALGLAAWRGRK
jgi:hypothetical protein